MGTSDVSDLCLEFQGQNSKQRDLGFPDTKLAVSTPEALEGQLNQHVFLVPTGPRMGERILRNFSPWHWGLAENIMYSRRDKSCLNKGAADVSPPSIWCVLHHGCSCAFALPPRH